MLRSRALEHGRIPDEQGAKLPTPVSALNGLVEQRCNRLFHC